VVFWVVAACSVTVRYQHLDGRAACVQGCDAWFKSKSHYDWRSVSQLFSQSVSQSVSPSWPRTPCGTHDHILICSRTITASVIMWRPLRRFYQLLGESVTLVQNNLFKTKQLIKYEFILQVRHPVSPRSGKQYMPYVSNLV